MFWLDVISAEFSYGRNTGLENTGIEVSFSEYPAKGAISGSEADFGTRIFALDCKT